MNQLLLIQTETPGGGPVAIFSPCRKWRYTLCRVWQPLLPLCAFIGLNPSTADEVRNDPTIRRCIGFARRWGCGGLVMLNAFAYRATDPREMKAQEDPVGPENDYWLRETSGRAEIIIAAWGIHGGFRGRQAEVMNLVPNMKCLGITKEGFPKHPLYLRGDSAPLPFIGR